MQLKDLHPTEKPVSTKVLYNGASTVIALNIKSGETLKEHVSKVPAQLICVVGGAIYREQGQEIRMQSGTVVDIQQDVLHSVTAIEDCQFLLIKQN
jgi:quercetin dioxygenase-like cupin family protein